jgi:hypothetical protein
VIDVVTAYDFKAWPSADRAAVDAVGRDPDDCGATRCPAGDFVRVLRWSFAEMQAAHDARLRLVRAEFLVTVKIRQS